MEKVSDEHWKLLEDKYNWYRQPNYEPKITTVLTGLNTLIHKVSVDMNVKFTEFDSSFIINFRTGSEIIRFWNVKVYTEYDVKDNVLSFALNLSDSTVDTPVQINLWIDNNRPPVNQVFSSGEIWEWKKSLPCYIGEKTKLKFELQIFETMFEKKEDDIFNKITTMFANDTDVVLRGDGWEYKAHRDILTRSSPVFQAMFQHEMSESTDGKVNIKDTDGKTVLSMLQYFYTGEISNLNQICDELLVLAHKYQVDRLKSICILFLSHNLQPNNVLKYLYFSDLYELISLKVCCLEFMKNNMEKVVDSEDWKKLEKTNLMCSVVKYFSNLQFYQL